MDLGSTRHRVAAAAMAAVVVVAAIVIVSRGGESTVEARGDAPATTTASPGTAAAPGSTLGPLAMIDAVGTVPGSTPPPETTAPVTEPPTTAPPAPPTSAAAPSTRAPTPPAPTTAPAPPPPPVTAAPTTTKAPPRPVPPASARRSVDAFRGLGAWLDVLDWSPSYDGVASAGLADIDIMAAHGVQTLYIQTSRFNREEDVLDRDLLLRLIARAHAKGMKVVGWYLPTHEDLDRDLRRLAAAANLPVDAIGVDIESTAQTNVAERNRQLVELSIHLRNNVSKPIAAIVIPPVVTDIINTKYWPGFPWKAIVDLYDVYLPMGYWTNRSGSTAEWRDAHRYTARNIELVRELTGKRVEVHAVGGIADETTPEDVAGMARAVAEQGALGGSLYDYITTADQALWPALQPLRR